MVYFEAGLAGLFTGGAYALVGVAIVLMFRSTGVLSFAHAAFAAVSAYLYVDLVDRDWPTWLAAVGAVVGATLYGLVVERVAIRPLRHANAVTRLIGTLGVLTFTSGVLLYQYGFSPLSAELLLPDENLDIGNVVVPYQQVAVLVAAAVAAVVLAVFLYRTRFGVAVRAVAQDSEAARLSGVSLEQVARFNWGLGALLAGITGVLVAPLQNLTVGTFTLLLAKSFAGTLLGGLASMSLAFVGGLAVGVLEAVSVVRFEAPGAPELVTLVFVALIVVLRRSWPAPAEAPPVARRARAAHPAVARIAGLWRSAAVPVALAGLVIALYIPANSSYWAFIGGRGLFFTIQALSLVLLSGWGGQVSLMQGAYVGLGAFGTAYLVDSQGMGLGPALVLSAVVGTGMGALVGLPALRLSGLQFAIVSLVFSGAAASWLFQWEELTSSLPRGDLFGIDLTSDIAVYFVMLAVAAVLFLAAWNLRRSSYGALLIAAREAGPTVDHFGGRSARTRMGTFLLASFMATLGGGLYAVLTTGFTPQDFSALLSLSLLVYAVVGGSQSLLGPVVAGVGFGVLPQLFQADAGSSASAVPDIIAGAVVVILLVWRPAGVASLFTPSTGAQARPEAPTTGEAAAPLRRARPPQREQVLAFVHRRRLANSSTSSDREVDNVATA